MKSRSVFERIASFHPRRCASLERVAYLGKNRPLRQHPARARRRPRARVGRHLAHDVAVGACRLLRLHERLELVVARAAARRRRRSGPPRSSRRACRSSRTSPSAPRGCSLALRDAALGHPVREQLRAVLRQPRPLLRCTSAGAAATAVQKSTEWSWRMRWQSSCTTTYVRIAGGARIRRQLNESAPAFEHEPQRVS